jgi:hypothetical protein
MERFRSDVPNALRDIARFVGPEGETRLKNHLVAMRFSEWLAREGEDAALERQPELLPIEVSAYTSTLTPAAPGACQERAQAAQQGPRQRGPPVCVWCVSLSAVGLHCHRAASRAVE